MGGRWRERMSRAQAEQGWGRKGWGVSSQERAHVTEQQPHDTSPVSPCGSSVTPSSHFYPKGSPKRRNLVM